MGCGKNEQKDITKKLSKKINNLKGYHLVGDLEIINNDDSYTYSIDVSYQKDDKFKVVLKNTVNDHEQIILKNTSDVYVLTPSLNKSFKFQSEWPYNNSQIYLLQTLLKDIEDKDTKMEKKEDYVFTTKANYSNSKDLVTQEIVFDKDLVLKKAQVLDSNGTVRMSITFKAVDLNATYKADYFDLKTNMPTSEELETYTPVSVIEDIIYPMYLPVNTTLTSQDKISGNGIERVIMTFSGDDNFTLVQETASQNESLSVTPVEGDPYLLADGVAAITNNTINWYSNGVEYFIASETLNQEELINVAASISVLPVGK